MVASFIQLALTESNATNCVFGSNTTNGNMIVVVWANFGTVFSSIPIFSDNIGNIYSTPVVSFVDNVTLNTQMFISYAKNITGGATTVSATASGNFGSYLAAFEINGINAFDNGSSGGSSDGDLASSGNFTTNFSNEIIIAATVNQNAGISAGTGYILIDNTPIFSSILEYGIFNTPGVQTATANITGNGSWSMIAGAFYNTSTPPLPTSSFLGSYSGRRF